MNRNAFQRWLLRFCAHSVILCSLVPTISQSVNWTPDERDAEGRLHSIDSDSISQRPNGFAFWKFVTLPEPTYQFGKYIDSIGLGIDVDCRRVTYSITSLRAYLRGAVVYSNDKPSEEFTDGHYQAGCKAWETRAKEAEPGPSSGTAWHAGNGNLVTAAHVVSGAKTISVVDSSGEKYAAKVVLLDAANDVAILNVAFPGQAPPALSLASAEPKLAESVLTIGFPFVTFLGKKPQITSGEISGQTGYEDDPRHLQISVPIQPGNSGGPLLNANGEVVGLVVATLNGLAVAKKTGSLPQAVSFALRASYVSSLLSRLRISPVDSGGGGIDSRTTVVEKRIPAVFLVLANDEDDKLALLQSEQRRKAEEDKRAAEETLRRKLAKVEEQQRLQEQERRELQKRKVDAQEKDIERKIAQENLQEEARRNQERECREQSKDRAHNVERGAATGGLANDIAVCIAESAKRKEEEARNKAEEYERKREGDLRKQEQERHEQLTKAEIDERARATELDTLKTLVGEYAARIREKILSNTKPSGRIRATDSATFKITLLPNGNVADLRLENSTGGAEFREAVELAIQHSQPLPIPSTDDRAFEQLRRITLKFNASALEK